MKKRLDQIHHDNLILEHIQLKNAHREWKYIEKIDLKDKNAVPFHLHIGMRTIKTVLAVYLSGVIGWVVGQPPLFSMFAAILCMQNKTDDTIKSAYNRFLGTLVGGFYAVSVVYISWTLKIPPNSLIYYTIISFMIMPVIFTTLYLRKPTTSALSCIVFVAITLSEFDFMNPLLTAIWRMIDTIIGIAIVVFLELIFPYHPQSAQISEAQKKEEAAKEINNMLKDATSSVEPVEPTETESPQDKN